MPHPWEQRWELGDRLGKGGQGVTHAATFLEDRTVTGALKYLKNNKDSQARGRMRREVANLQTLANAGGAVPRVLDHNTGQFEDKSVELFVVMDLIAGPTLTEHLRSCGHLSIDAAVAFTQSLCRTVQLAHTFPILHRDLKPDNIIVKAAEPPDLVVVDYGLSFNADGDELTELEETFRNRFLDLPETNTPSGDRRDPRSDLTAICAVLYFCLTGNVPGQLQDGSGTLPHMRTGLSLRDKHSGERLPYLEEFLNRGFAPNIANRFQTIDELQTGLAAFAVAEANLDEGDPIKLAASLSRRLRANDRTTQIAEFQKHAQALFQFIQNEANKYHEKLGRFTLTNLGGGFGFGGGNIQQTKLPDGLDLVAHSQITIVVQAQYHPRQKHRRYAVASRGEQCVLLVADYDVQNARQSRAGQQQFDWQEVAWFEGNAEPIHNLVSVSYRDWLTAKLKELAEEILA